MRRSVRAVHAGRADRGRARGGRASCSASGITTILTALGENLTERGGGRGGHAALPRRVRQGRRRRARRAHLGQADAARARPRSRAVRAQPGSADRARRAARQLPLDRHGELAATSIPRSSSSRAPAREVAAGRHRAPGLSLSHGEGPRIADPARPGDPHRQGRVPRTARRRVSEEVGRRRELLQAVRPAAVARRAASRRRCCTSPRTTSRWSIA